jgi:hypothetical protein
MSSATCWQPVDDCSLSFECDAQGVENKLMDVRETETCVYEMKFTTPAACEDGAAGVATTGGGSKQEL